MLKMPVFKRKLREKGIALAYVLAFIALLTLATTYLAKTQRGVAQSVSNQENKIALLDQATLIRSRIIGCAVSYPAGDNATGIRPQYPASPVSGLVKDLTCPGQPGANNLWTGSGGLTLPAPPRMFNDWRYVNLASGMKISIQARTADDPSTLGIMDAIALRLGSAATRVGDTMMIVLVN